MLFDAQQKRWLSFEDPLEIIEARHLSDVKVKLRRVEQCVADRQLWAAGFLSYEAAPAFDATLVTHDSHRLPLLWFGVYEQPRVLDCLDGVLVREFTPLEWIPTISREEYGAAIKRVKELIAVGDTYQVNFTFRMHADLGAQFPAWEYFRNLVQGQEAQYCAFIDTGRFAVCSVSPELFFRLDGSRIVTRPMKGTVRRGRTNSEDQQLSEWLRKSEKNRAENVMIVDMMRNDCGRIAEIGSVSVPQLFNLERYPTVWQMTSEVTALTGASISEIMAALFPAASVTGAPKPRTMKIISELESSPRGIYTGCVGYFGPRRVAQFNVAIRTVLIDQERRVAEYGVGGGIVWDSTSAEEYDECLTKSLVLTKQIRDFSLIETLLWTSEEGYFLLDRHLTRIADSAKYFGYRLSVSEIERALRKLASILSGRQRVRLLVNREGEITLQHSSIGGDSNDRPVRLRLAANPIDARDTFLFHKTSIRKVYKDARSKVSDCDDVILWNRDGEVTETCIDNIVVQLADNSFVTPRIEAGLLAGTYRAMLLEEKKIREGIVMIDDLKTAPAIAVINSVRGWRAAEVIFE